MAQDTFRFAVGEPDGARSVVWRVWTNPSRNDIYIAARHLGGVYKVSLHGSGKWRIAFEGPRSPFIPEGGDRATTKWNRPADLAPGWTRGFSVAVPASEVVEGKAVVADPHKLYWAPKPAGEAAVEFHLFLSPPQVTGVADWPGRH